MNAVRSVQRLAAQAGCSRFVFNRRLSSSPHAKCEDISFELPMGTIAGKVWGSGPHPILAVHGWLDNCGSFDPIIPRLPLDKFHVIAVDLPGHGFSQKHPPGMSYTITDGLVLIKKTQASDSPFYMPEDAATRL